MLTEETTNRIRTATAITGAVALIGEGVVEIANRQFNANGSFRLLETLLACGMLLTLAAVAELHARVPRTKLRDIGFWAFGAGQLAVGLVATARAVDGTEVLGPVFGIGALAWVLGAITIGISAARGRPDHRALLIGVPLAMLAAFAVGNGGLVIAGAYWLVATLALMAPVARLQAQ
ncbi:MAG: hypothetical protein ACRDKE_04710 [Solirubrobacterales bacterium]